MKADAIFPMIHIYNSSLLFLYHKTYGSKPFILYFLFLSIPRNTLSSDSRLQHIDIKLSSLTFESYNFLLVVATQNHLWILGSWRVFLSLRWTTACQSQTTLFFLSSPQQPDKPPITVHPWIQRKLKLTHQAGSSPAIFSMSWRINQAWMKQNILKARKNGKITIYKLPLKNSLLSGLENLPTIISLW